MVANRKNSDALRQVVSLRLSPACIETLDQLVDEERSVLKPARGDSINRSRVVEKLVMEKANARLDRQEESR